MNDTKELITKAKWILSLVCLDNEFTVLDLSRVGPEEEWHTAVCMAQQMWADKHYN